MNLSKKFFLVFCLCFGFIEAAAQYRIDQWTADDGLPQNSVYGIVQTRDGYLWLATLDGLARFDGARFTIFNKSNSPGIINNRFTSLFEDAQGALWAWTEASGMVRYHNGRFSNFRAGEGDRIDWIGSDPDGNPMSFLSESKAIHFVDGKFSSFDARANSPETARLASRQNVRAYCSPDTPAAFLDCYANGRWLSVSMAGGSSDYKLLSAAQDADGNFWLVTDRRELVCIENGKVARVFNEASGLPKYPLDFITGAKLSLVSWDGKDSLWLTDLATMRNELLLKTPADAPIESGDIYPLYTEGEGIFKSSYQDGEGNLWFGTLRGGLYRARKQVVTAFSTAEGLTDNNVYPLYENDDGTLLVGTTSGVFNLQNGHFAPIESPKDWVHAFGRDPAGRIVFSNGSDLYVREANRSVPFLQGKISSQGLIQAIHSDRENALWIGAGEGLMRFKDDALTRFTTGNGLAGNDVKVIIEARAGGLWIGTYGGLSRYQNGQLTSWTEGDGLPSRTIRALYEDADGTLWIGTYDGGLARFKDGRFTHYNTKRGLYNDGAFQILEDERSNFWISSNHGIYRVSKDELNEFADGKRAGVTSIAYGKSDGMLNAECNGGRSPGGVKTRDGRLWFPTQNGVAMIDPREIKINSQPPPVVIESFKIDNELIELPALADRTSPAENSPDNANGSNIIIEPFQQNFEINYTALSFINSENLRFKYKLEGIDDDWIDAGTRRLAYFSHVPPGDYTFKVIAANSDGVWNVEGKSLNIKILPPFYKTWWFMALLAFLFSGLIISAFRIRFNQLEKARAAQEEFSRKLLASQEQERQRIAAELHDSLGQSLLIIKNRIALAQTDIDEKETVEEQLGELSHSATSAIEECREIAYNLRPYQISRFGLSKTLYGIFMRINEVTGINATAEMDDIDDLLSDDAQINVYRIVQECVNNIIKHSEAAEASLMIKQTDGEISLLIQDNGRGFVKNETGTDNNKISGFGLVGIAERVKILHGSYEIDSSPNRGTKIRIKINN